MDLDTPRLAVIGSSLAFVLWLSAMKTRNKWRNINHEGCVVIVLTRYLFRARCGKQPLHKQKTFRLTAPVGCRPVQPWTERVERREGWEEEGGEEEGNAPVSTANPTEGMGMTAVRGKERIKQNVRHCRQLKSTLLTSWDYIQQKKKKLPQTMWQL